MRPQTSVWKRKWFSMMPASRYDADAWLAPFSSATNAPSEPHSSTSTQGKTMTSNQRCGLRAST
jgi:hypothetical protein